jgi:serine protease
VTAQRLSEQPEVLYAQPNYIRRLPAARSNLAVAVETAAPTAAATRALTVIPNDPAFGTLQWNFALIDAPGAWAINPGATSSITVATIDTGVTTAATSLTVPLWTGQTFEQTTIPYAVSPDITASRLLPGHDFVFMPSGPVLDMHGHGTHVASTIGEDTNNLKGLAGLAYNVRIMPLKVCLGYWDVMIASGQRGIPGFASPDAGGCPDDAIVNAIHYAVDNGANIINLSLGGTDSAPAEQDALQYAAQHNVFVSIAMGNDAQNGNPTEYPASYAAGIDGVMSVSAVGKSQTHAYYSSTGSYNEIAAPGGNDLDGGGLDKGYVWQVTLLPSDSDPTLLTKPRFDRYAEVAYEGTSMATPHVSGLAALLMSQGKSRTAAAVEALIKATAKDLGAAGKDDTFGYGLIQARNSLFGFGIAR